MLKYIDIPLKIPVAPAEIHRDKIRSRLEPEISEDWRLEEVAYEAIGSIPTRDVLRAAAGLHVAEFLGRQIAARSI